MVERYYIFCNLPAAVSLLTASTQRSNNLSPDEARDRLARRKKIFRGGNKVRGRRVPFLSQFILGQERLGDDNAFDIKRFRISE